MVVIFLKKLINYLNNLFLGIKLAKICQMYLSLSLFLYQPSRVLQLSFGKYPEILLNGDSGFSQSKTSSHLSKSFQPFLQLNQYQKSKINRCLIPHLKIISYIKDASRYFFYNFFISTSTLHTRSNKKNHIGFQFIFCIPNKT